jgi:hypothetical protein
MRPASSAHRTTPRRLLRLRRASNLIGLSYGSSLLTVNSCIKVRLDLQEDESSVGVKGPFFPQV